MQDGAGPVLSAPLCLVHRGVRHGKKFLERALERRRAHKREVLLKRQFSAAERLFATLHAKSNNFASQMTRSYFAKQIEYTGYFITARREKYDGIDSVYG